MSVCFECAKNGDPSAKEALIDALRSRIAKMAAYYARRCGEEADDLLQEAWFGLLEALPDLDTTIGHPEQYLLRHARWRLLDAVKRARVRRCLPLDESPSLSSQPPASEEGFASAFASAFMAQLSGAQRAVLGCLLTGLTWREAGEVLGCTSANIAYYVRQIRQQYEAWTG